MEFVRSSIVKYLNDGMANSKYAKTIREMGDKTTWASKELEALKTMTYDDFDFIDVLKELFNQIKVNYSMFVSDPKWTPSNRQECLLGILDQVINSILHEDYGEKRHNYYLYNFQEFYWESYDYFHDYGNKNETLCKEEIDLIIPYFERFFDEVWKGHCNK